MNKTHVLLIEIICVLSIKAFAQNSLDTVWFASHLLSVKKQAAIINYVKLSEAEKSAFHTVYKKYHNNTRNLETECLLLIYNYSRNFDHLSQDQSTQIRKHVMKSDLLLAKFRKQYFKKLKKVLSAEKANELIQMECAYRNIARLKIQNPEQGDELLFALNQR